MGLGERHVRHSFAGLLLLLPEQRYSRWMSQHLSFSMLRWPRYEKAKYGRTYH